MGGPPPIGVMIAMSQEILHERRQALEESFFARKNEELRVKLKEKLENADKRVALASISGIQNDTILDSLIQAGIEAETVAATSLVPLIAVAWADGTIADNERNAVLQAASDNGIGQDDIAYDLLQDWLNHKPEASLLQAWSSFMSTLGEGLDDSARTEFKSDVMGRARRVAEAAGGLLGLGSVSDAESQVLTTIEAAL